ncbi:MAG: hypothetical protein U9Q62_02190 [Campylobacterota bacterium]|nr:hypothetical protein [Campylobacterota bacterium]
MHIRQYTIATIIFMIIMGWYTFAFITQESATIDLFILHLTLPVAFWVVVPVLLFYFASVFHMLYYWIVLRLRLRQFKSDFAKLTEAISDAYLGKANRNTLYKTERYKLLGKLIDRSIMIPSDTLLEVGEEKIDSTLSLLNAVRNGESIELKKVQLDKNNPIVVNNLINRIENGDMKAANILSKSDAYSEEVCAKAFDLMVPDQPLYELEKYKSHMSKATLFNLMKHIGVDKNKLEVSNESMITMISEHTLDEDEFVALSKILSKSLLPDQRIKIFEMLYDKNDEATAAYLYTLFDLEMIELADEVLNQVRPDEYMAFRAYRDLKAVNKHYVIDLFVK